MKVIALVGVDFSKNPEQLNIFSWFYYFLMAKKTWLVLDVPFSWSLSEIKNNAKKAAADKLLGNSRE